MVEEGRTLNGISQTLKSQVTILGSIVLLFWILEIFDVVLFNNGLNSFGVRPRTITGLPGILFMPILHNGLGHVLANTVPFLVLGWLVMVRRTADFFVVTFIVILVSGAGIWLLGGSNTVHIGASGLIFGYFGFLILRGYFERSFISIIMALIVFFIYGGILWGVLPTFQSEISWLGHLFGFIGGAIAANLVTSRQQKSDVTIRILEKQE